MSQKIYFICPENKAPAGGIKQLYKQVDLLNKNGMNAVILHKKRGFRHKWFDNTTRIEYNRPLFMQIRWGTKKHKIPFLKQLFNTLIFKFQNVLASKLDHNALFVFPEIYSQSFKELKQEYQKVIFNQNCYYTFRYNTIDDAVSQNPYTDKNILATIVVSEDSKNYLSFAIPGITLHRIRLGIDDSKFFHETKKRKQIAFMPRKLEDDITQITNILKYRNSLGDWSLVSIDNKSEAEVARVMRESHIFLSFNHIEGFGLPPVEAMACGCIVIGYTGRAGEEYFNPDFSYPVSDGNIIDFVSQIEAVISLFETDRTTFLEKQKKASRAILAEYNLQNEEHDIVTTWKTILEASNAKKLLS